MSLIGHRYQAVPAVLETGNPKWHKGLFGMSFDHMQVYCPTLSKHKFISWLKSEGYRAYLALSTLLRLTMKPDLFCRVAASSEQANRADAVTVRHLSFGSVARATHRRR